MNRFPDRPFLYSELASSGIPRRQLRNAIARGLVRQVLHGVYCPAALPDTIDLRAQSAALVLPDHVVVSDHTAAWLHGIDAFDPAALDVTPKLETVSFEGKRTRRVDVLGGKRALLDEDICVVGGLTVTTPLRTACDLACLRGRYSSLAVLDAFMRAFDLTVADFKRMVRRYAGRRGVVQLRELIQYATPLAESVGESWTRMAIIDAGLPVPRPQVWVELASGKRFRLDLAYPHLKIAIEYDGFDFHSAQDEQRTADRKRRAALRRAGWIVIVVRKHDFAGAALDGWLGQLRGAVHERLPVHRREYPRPSRDSRQAYRAWR